MTSSSDRVLVVREFDGSQFPSGTPTLETAWVGIYQVLWWYIGDPRLIALEQMRYGTIPMPPEVTDAFAVATSYLRATQGAPILHVREANDLGKRVWQQRAAIAQGYIAETLGVEADELPALFDRMMLLPRWAGKQRNNPVGNGLRILLSEILTRWGDERFAYEEEAPATSWFPGIVMPGRSKNPKVDVAAVSDGQPSALISCKWSIRHDRISDPTNECQEYRAAAMKRQFPLSYYVLTNELDWQRLEKVLNQPCVDGLIHVHLGLLDQVLGGESDAMAAARKASRLLDLTEFVSLTSTWA